MNTTPLALPDAGARPPTMLEQCSGMFSPETHGKELVADVVLACGLARPDPAGLADQVFTALSANKYGVFDGLVATMVPARGDAEGVAPVRHPARAGVRCSTAPTHPGMPSPGGDAYAGSVSRPASASSLKPPAL